MLRRCAGVILLDPKNRRGIPVPKGLTVKEFVFMRRHEQCHDHCLRPNGEACDGTGWPIVELRNA